MVGSLFFVMLASFQMFGECVFEFDFGYIFFWVFLPDFLFLELIVLFPLSL